MASATLMNGNLCLLDDILRSTALQHANFVNATNQGLWDACFSFANCWIVLSYCCPVYGMNRVMNHTVKIGLRAADV